MNQIASQRRNLYPCNLHFFLTCSGEARFTRVMHVDRIPNRTSPPAYLLRETYREGEKVKKRTLANISDWAIAKIEALRRVLRGDFSSGDCQGQELTLL